MLVCKYIDQYFEDHFQVIQLLTNFEMRDVFQIPIIITTI